MTPIEEKYSLDEDDNLRIDLYINLLIGKNINHYKKVSKGIAKSLGMPVQDLIRIIFNRADIKRNIVIKSYREVVLHD